MTASQRLTVFFGSIVHSLSLEKLEILPRASIGVSQDGIIVFVDKSSRSPLEAAKSYGVGEENVTIVTSPHASSFFFPGFIDTHIVSTSDCVFDSFPNSV